MRAADAERRDQPVADRERGEQRHLLGADRRDECLEGIRRKRWTESRERRHESCEHGLGRRERGEGVEVELQSEELADDRLRLRVERLDVDTAVRRLDANLSAVDDAVQSAFAPEVREVRPEGAIALGRELEVVRLRDGQQGHAANLKRVRPRGSDPWSDPWSGP